MVQVRFYQGNPQDAERQLQQYRNCGWSIPRGADRDHINTTVGLPKRVTKYNQNDRGEIISETSTPGNRYTLEQCLDIVGTNFKFGKRETIEAIAALHVFNLFCQVYEPIKVSSRASTLYAQSSEPDERPSQLVLPSLFSSK